MADVFISYSRDNREQVRHIAEELEREGYSVWWDPDIPPGESFSEVIDGALKSAKAIIVAWSPSSVRSNWVQEEADDGMMRSMLIPVMIENVDLPRGFKRLQTADLRGWDGDSENVDWRMVLNQVDKHVQSAAMTARMKERTATPPPLHKTPKANATETARSTSKKSGGFGLLIGGIIALAAIAAGGFLLGPKIFGQPPAESANEIEVAQADQVGSPVIEQASDTPRAIATSGAPADAPIEGVTPEAPGGEVGETEFVDVFANEDDGQKAEDGLQAALDDAAIDSATGDVDTTPAEAIEATAETAPTPITVALEPGATLRDCDSCPQMVQIAAGKFILGAPESEQSRDTAETPQKEISIEKPFALGIYEVTFDEWGACIADRACNDYTPSTMSWGAGSRPVVNISWDDANAYISWLSQKTGQAYRLPSEAEWEYAARAGTEGPFSYGGSITTADANFNGNFAYGGAAKSTYRSKTTPVGSFKPNAFGLHDMHGNVWEWTADCWKPNHSSAPADGSAVGGACSQRVLKGGAWNAGGWRLRSAHRITGAQGRRDFDNGFRVARDF